MDVSKAHPSLERLMTGIIAHRTDSCASPDSENSDSVGLMKGALCELVPAEALWLG